MTQQSVGECIYHRRTEDLKNSPNMACRRKEGETRQFVVRARSSKWQRGSFRVD